MKLDRERDGIVLILAALALAILVVALATPSRASELPPAPALRGVPHGDADRSALLQHVSVDAVPRAAYGTPLSGLATWYGTGPGAGHAAAGAELRTGHWRGRHVRVCHDGCVTVVLDDWCACAGNRIIDLSDEDFARLAPLSTGVIRVTVTAVGVEPRSGDPTAPPTDTE